MTNSIVEFAMSDPQISEAFQLHLARLETALSGAIEWAKRAGELVWDVTASEAAALLVCTQGLNVLAKTRPDRNTLEAITRHTFVAVGFKPWISTFWMGEFLVLYSLCIDSLTQAFSCEGTFSCAVAFNEHNNPLGVSASN